MRYLITIALILMANIAQADTITVSTRQQLLNAVAAVTPGDIIEISNGVYTNWGIIILPRTSDGIANQRIILRAQTKGNVIFRDQGALQLVARSAFWDIRDLVWENQTGFDEYAGNAPGTNGLINIDGAQDLVVEGNTMRNLNGSGVVVPIMEFQGGRQTRRITIRNNVVDGYTQTGRSTWTYMYGGVGRGFVRDIEISGNSLLNRTCNTTQRFCYWIKFGDSPNSALYDSGLSIIGNNFQFDTPSAAGQDVMHLKGRKITVKNNLYHFTGGMTFRQGSGHIISNNTFMNPNTSRQRVQLRIFEDSHQIINNIFFTTIASRMGLNLGKGTPDLNGDGKITYPVFRDSLIAHNTFDGFRDAAISMAINNSDSDDGVTTIFPSGIVFHNNVVRQTTGIMFEGDNCASRFASISHNSRSGAATPDCMATGTNNVVAAPQWEAGGYAPAEGSPLIDAGIALPSYPETRLDMFGSERDSSPDIGSIEFGGDPPPPPPPGQCDDIFSTASGYILCEETEFTCSFNVNLNGGTCNDVCGSFGKACVGAIDNPPSSCTEISPNFDTCSSVRADEICICEVGDPPPPPPQGVRYVDAACPTPGNGTTETCGVNGPWNSLAYALQTVSCVGMVPGNILEVKGMNTTPANGNWYGDTYYSPVAVNPGIGCNGIIVQPAEGEHIVLDGTVDIKSKPWVHIGSNVYECQDPTCGTSANFPFTAWVGIGGTEHRLDLIQSVRTCQTSLAAGKMTYNPTNRRVCVHLPDDSNPASADYVRIPSHNTAIQLYNSNVSDITFRNNPAGGSSFTITRYRDRLFDLSAEFNKNVRIDGLNLSWALRRGISSDTTTPANPIGTYDGNHIITNNDISYVGEYGILWRGDIGVSLIEDNIIHNIGVSPVFEQCNGVGAGCLPAYSDNTVAILANNCAPLNGVLRGSISRNMIHNIGGGRAGISDGIGLSDCTYFNSIDANLFYDSSGSNGFTAIRLTGISNGRYHDRNSITNNRCEDVDRCLRTHYNTVVIGIDENGENIIGFADQTGRRQFVYGNTCYNPNIDCWSQGDGGSIGGELWFRNNLAVKDDGYVPLMTVSSPTFWSSMQNNGFECNDASCVGQPIISWLGTNYFRDGECTDGTNCISDIPTSNIYGSFDVQAETLQITATSDSIDRGQNLSLLTTDAFGNPRPFGQASDIGAHEFTATDLAMMLTQDGFQVFNRFSVNGVEPLAGIDEIPTLYRNAQYTLRIRLYGEADSIEDTADLVLYAQHCDPTCGAYEQITLTCVGNAACLIDNPLTTDGTAITNKMPLSGRSFSSNSNYVDGEEEGDGHAYLIGPNQQLELEFSLGMGSLVSPDDSVKFQVRHVDGSALNTYGVIPEIRIGQMRGRMEMNR